MNPTGRPIKIISLSMVAAGVALLALNIAAGGKYNVALPLVFLLLGGAFALLVFVTRPLWRWHPLFYIPAALMLALGLVFLINVLTGDWDAWAFAWLLPVASLGAGAALAARQMGQATPGAWYGSNTVQLTCIGLAAAGLTFFAIFGAIARGLFIQVVAALLIIAAGVSLRWLRLERILPDAARRALGLAPREPGQLAASPAAAAQPAARIQVEPLVEPLSARELEVLALVDAGLTNQQIAQRLGVASSTIKTHINNIYGKLGTQTRVQAVRRARELHLLGQ